MGQLVIVATPIGNLEDVGARTVRALREADLVLAEDTRVTRRLLARYGIATPLASFHAHSTPARRAQLQAEWGDRVIAYATDAGMPGISDPGAELVAMAVAAGHTVTAVPGPSAVTTALALAGFGADAFTFVGFLPRRPGDRRSRLVELATLTHPIVLFEAPHRLCAALDALVEVLGNRPAVACRELTKIHEEVVRGSLAELRGVWTARAPRGEFTLVVAGAPTPIRAAWTDDDVAAAMAERHAAGVGRRAAAREVAEQAGWPARDAYRLWPASP